MRQFLQLVKLPKSLGTSGCLLSFQKAEKHCLAVTGVSELLKQILLPGIHNVQLQPPTVQICATEKDEEIFCANLHTNIAILFLIPQKGCLNFSQVILHGTTSYSVAEKRKTVMIFYLESLCQCCTIFISFVFSIKGDKTYSGRKDFIDGPSCSSRLNIFTHKP